MGSSDDARSDTVPDTSPQPRTRASRLSLPSYDIGSLLGKGGMGEVLIARDPEIGRDVAIKRMNDSDGSPAALARFLREAKIQARLEHPAIVPVHELGRDSEGRPYFTMKRITGTTLHDVLRGPPRGLPALLRVFVDVCRAIEFAHAKHVVHRDLKPANIMLGDFGEVYVLDWGLARVTSEADEPRSNDDLALLQGLTAAGAVLGTPGYMAPEQIRDPSVGPAADVYALGSILFEILAGEPLHPRDDALASTLAKHLRTPAASAQVPPELEGVCVAALGPDPGARPSARDLAESVQQYLDGDRDLERRRTKSAEELARARELIGDPARRAEASQHAGRALALDPESREAAALVTRLIVEPPPVLPDELRERLAQLDTMQTLRTVGLARFALLGFYILIPLVLWMGIVDRGVFALMIGFVTAHLAFAHWQFRSGRAYDIATLATNMILLVLVSRVFGSYVFVPAAVCAIAWGLGQQAGLLERRALFTGGMIVAFLVPLLLEQLGVLHSTSLIGDGQLVITSPLFRIGGAATQAMLIAGNLFAILVATVFGQHVSIARRRAQHDLEIQAWHLEKMVPGVAAHR